MVTHATGTHTTYDDLGPGLHVLREPEPAKLAKTLAADLRADLCATLPQAEAALEERSAFPLVDAPTLATLLMLARRLARAQRIAARTHERAVVEVGHTLAGAGGGLAVHPTTIRDRAAAVEIARGDLAAAELALIDHAAAAAAAASQAESTAAAAATAVGEAQIQREAERGLRQAKLSAPSSLLIGLLVAAVVLGLALLALDVDPWVAPLPAVLAGLVALRRPRSNDQMSDDQRGREEASSLLSQVAASADDLFGVRRASREVEEQTILLEARRDRVAERVRVAERAWDALVGEGVDIAELEDVLRRFDPQHDAARLLAGETVGVRTTGVVLHHFQQRWQAFWRELGLEAPVPEAGEEAVRKLAARVSRAIVLVGPATELGAELSSVAPAAAVVVLDGSSDEPGLS